MVSFAKRILQVFVSSTYNDLKHERQAAVEAILSAGHIPAGMELFAAGDESQMEVIKQWIEQSDIYLLILGGRYGSIERKTGKSYIQLEYEYALALRKPLFACVINEEALEARIKTYGSSVVEMNHRQELNEFRRFVLTKMVKFWDDCKDIKISVIEAISHISRRDDLVGWIRPLSEPDTVALANEIARLSKENSQLRSQLQDIAAPILGLTFAQLKMMLGKKGLLDCLQPDRFLSEGTRGIFFQPNGEIEYRKAEELCIIGIFAETEGRSSGYRLTDEGLVFMNQLRSEEVSDATRSD